MCLVFLIATHLKTLVVLLLLLVYDSESEIYFIGLLEAWFHLHYLGECFLGMVKRTVAVVQYTDAVPEFRFLRDMESIAGRQGQRLGTLRTFGLRRLIKAFW